MTYSVTVWRESGDTRWTATADDVDGAVTDGRSLKEVDRNIREAIAVALDLPRGAEDTMDIDLRVKVSQEVDELVTEARAARDAAKRAEALTASAARALRSRGVSVRDTGRIVGLTSGRITQLEKKSEKRA